MFAKKALPLAALLLCAAACAKKVNTTAGIIALPARLVIPTAPSRVGDPSVYPDFARTPGAANLKITQANIGDTICSKTWSTKTIRPPASYTTGLKVKQMAALGLPGTTADYEEDHFVSLELGGHPTDERNLWPEPYGDAGHVMTVKERSASDKAGTASLLPNSVQKDAVENYVHDEVCFDIPNHKTSSDKLHPATVQVSLKRGQEILAGDWFACYQNYLQKQPCKTKAISQKQPVTKAISQKQPCN